MNTMPNRFAILVDGDYLHAAMSSTLYGAQRSRLDLALDYDACLKFVREKASGLVQGQLLRVYWHELLSDGLPDEVHFALAIKPQVKLVTSHTEAARAGAADVAGLADVLRGLAVHRAVSDVVLVTGNADLAAAICEAQSYGISVHALTLGQADQASAVAMELLREVDTFAHVPVDEIKKNFKPRVGAREVADASGVPDAEREVIERVVDQVIGATSDSDLEVLLSKHTRGNLPRSVDRELLVVAQRELNRELTRREKRYMREVFYDIAQYEMSPDSADDSGARAA